MTPFVVADAGGEIVRHGVTPDPSVHADAGQVVEGDGDPTTHHVAAGAIVAYTDAQRATKAVRPAFAAEWSNATFAWIDRRELAQARADGLASVKSSRDASIFGGFEWDSSRFDSDQVAQMRMMGLFVTSAEPDFQPVAWRLADNSWRVLDAADVAGLWRALQAHIAAAFEWFAVKEVEISMAATAMEISAIARR